MAEPVEGGWRRLSPSEWAAHPLNRYRGWLLALVLLHLIALFGVAVIAVAILTDWREVLPYPESTQNGLICLVGAVEALLFLIAVGYRWRYTAEAVLAAVLLSRWAQMAIDLSVWPDDASLLVEYELSLAFWALVVAYLFFSRRANVMFRRRERI